MAKLVDPDSLSEGVEIDVLTGTKQIRSNIAGNLDNASPGASSGVTEQARYSFLKERWKDNNTLNKFKFPLKAFTKNEFLWINGWANADATTRLLVRDAGWQESVGAEAGDLYACFISLGNHDETTDQSYYQQTAGFDQSTTDFDKTGNINEAVLIYDASGPTDYTAFFKAFLRIQGKTYDSYDLLNEQGIPVLEATLYRFPLANGTDLDITETDVNIDANAPYTSMSLDYLTGNHSTVTTWAATTAYALGDIVLVGAGAYAGRYLRCTTAGTSGASDPTGAGADGTVVWEVDPGERQIGSTYYHFSRIVDGALALHGLIYNWGQRQLRKTTDINANTAGDAFGTVNGNVADELFFFEGTNLILEEGVWIDNRNADSTNFIKPQPHPVDGAAVARVSFPVVSSGTFEFSDNIVNALDADTRLVVYFTNDDAGDNAGNDFDTINAQIVNDNSSTPLDMQVTAASIPWDYDFTNNIQRGAASAATPVPITCQLVGLADYENQFFEFIIQSGSGQTFSINANDERNYSNPA